MDAPTTVETLLAAAGLKHAGSAPWLTPIPEYQTGVYFVSLSEDPASEDGIEDAPVSKARVVELLAARPELRVDSKRPHGDALAARYRECWIPGTPIIYIGGTDDSLRKRVDRFYQTPLGARGPHAGGYFVKMIDVPLFVHWAVAPVATATVEGSLVDAFEAALPDAVRSRLHDPRCGFPFANLEHPVQRARYRKRHGITGHTEPRS